MAKKTKTELPTIEVKEFKEKIEDAAARLLEDSVPNKKVVKNVVKTFIGVAEGQFKVNGYFSWEDKRHIMDRVFARISR